MDSNLLTSDDIAEYCRVPPHPIPHDVAPYRYSKIPALTNYKSMFRPRKGFAETSLARGEELGYTNSAGHLGNFEMFHENFVSKSTKTLLLKNKRKGFNHNM